MPRKPFDGNPRLCNGCNVKHTDFYADGRCKRCQKTKNKKTNAKRDNAVRRESYAQNRPQSVGSKFIVESAIRGRITPNEVKKFIGEESDFEKYEAKKKLVRSLNGEVGAACWVLDHYVPVGVLHQDSNGLFWSGSNHPDNIIITTVEENKAKASRKAEAQYLKPPYAIQRDFKRFNKAEVLKFAEMENIIRSKVRFDISGGDKKYQKPQKLNPNDYELLTPEDFVFPEVGAWFATLSRKRQKQFSKRRWREECRRIEAEEAAAKAVEHTRKKQPATPRIEGFELVLSKCSHAGNRQAVRAVRQLLNDVQLLSVILESGEVPEGYRLVGNPRWGDYIRAKKILNFYIERIQLYEPFEWFDLGWHIERPAPPAATTFTFEGIE
ncbi:hypothetical protein [Vibrio rotiferianus]|uniref:hypothetical protein n=1 Tax=Vibrio rotiferianus TaxID=190895 RepID=UPI00023771E2|nr:hypothetical protein [Vibrio rotiferianus]